LFVASQVLLHKMSDKV